MSYLYSAALAEAFWEANSSAGARSALSRSIYMPRAFFSPDKTTDFSRLSRFGMTFEPSTGFFGEDLLTWFREASRVRTSASPARVQESTESAPDSGVTWRASLAKFDPDTCSWKTAQLSLLEDSELSSVIWPRSGMTQGGQCWELPMSALRTNETAYGLWPTPSGTSNHGKNHVAGRLDEWGGSSNPFRGTPLASVRCPLFEEWMMGWPLGWSELTASATDKYLNALPQPGEFLEA